jgi:hypothetical protein
MAGIIAWCENIGDGFHAVRRVRQRVEQFIHRVAGFSVLQPSQEPDSDLQTGNPRASAIRTIAEAIFSC